MREKVLLVLFVLTFPLVAFVSTLPPERFRNEITEWGDRSSLVYQQFSEYRDKFGVNEPVILSWPGCDLSDPRVEKVAVSIEAELAGKVRNVSSGLRAYWSLTDNAKLSEEVALERLRNVMIGQLDETTAVGFQLTEAARASRGDVLTQLDLILESAGVDPEEAIYAGLGHNLYTMDKEGLESPFRMVPQIMLLAFVLTILFVRHLGLAFFINALGAYTGCLAFNIVWLADVDMNAIIWPLPTLTMLLTVSASLHFLSYFRKSAESLTGYETIQHSVRSTGFSRQTDELKHRIPPKGDTTNRDSLVWRRAVARDAVRAATKPVLYCTATTAIGLLSLMLSSSEPVRQFGLFGALSVSAGNLLLLMWLPAWLTWIGYAERIRIKSSVANENDGLAALPSVNRSGWQRWEWLTRSGRWPIIGLCLAALLVGAIGIPKVKTGSELTNFFPAGHQALTSAKALETRVGPLNSVELLLRFDNAVLANDRNRLKGMQALAGQIQSRTSFESCLSAATFAPKIKRDLSGIRGSVEKSRLRKFKEELEKASLLHCDETTGQETWRVSCRYSVSKQIDLARETEKLERIANELFVPDGQNLLSGERLATCVTGEFVLFDFVDRQFFKELLLTYLTAFAVISLIVLIVLRSFKASLIALLPNLFPALVVLGTVGFLGYSLDVASLTTASVALGIAVDDTLHFLLWHREAQKRNQILGGETGAEGFEEPVYSALRYCGTAMVQTSTILGMSIVLYAFCGFLPTVRFGILLSAMMMAALIGDLLLLPALMALSQKR